MGMDIFPGYEFGKTLDLNSLSTISKKNEKNFKYLFLVSLKDIDPGQELVAQYLERLCILKTLIFTVSNAYRTLTGSNKIHASKLFLINSFLTLSSR